MAELLLFHQWQQLTEWIEGNINSFSKDEFSSEVLEGLNSPLWITGHIVHIEDLLGVYLKREDLIYPLFREKFAPGSKGEIDDLPSADEVLAAWKNIKNINNEILSHITEAELAKPLEEGNVLRKDLELFKTKGRTWAIWNTHQSYHNGQLAMLLAKLGKQKF